jgi:hypothetical protein
MPTLAAMLVCEECGIRSVGNAWHWIATLAFDPLEDEYPSAVTYCPECAERHFEYSTRRRYLQIARLWRAAQESTGEA